MSWQTVTLGDIATFSNGINFDKSAYTSGVKFIGVSNFGDRFKPDYSELSEVKKEVIRKSDYLADGDIVFVRSNGNKALVGRCMLVQNAPEPVTFSGFCIRCHITDTTLFDPVFMTYHFKSAMFRQAMSGTAVGANIQNLSQGRMTAYTAKIPDIETQRRIASILSAYDDLIENNQKQIKLLEEAAQRLYKEWFVDLRFPGWETAEIVDGVPVGWRKVQLSELCSVLRRGISPKYNEKGKYQVINQKCIRTSIMDMSEARRQEKDYSADLNLQDADTIICSTGTGTLGRVGQVYGEHENTTFDSHVTLVRASNNANFIYQAIKEKQSFLMGMGRGSTNQQELYKGVIEALEILVPTDEILISFENMVSGIHNKTTVLVAQIERLTYARDRLLPKLMSGEIEV